MEIIEKQVEKVKEVPADNYGYNYGRRDINGKANAGLTLGIIGTALGAWALFGGRRSASLLGGTGTGSGADANIAIATCGGQIKFNLPLTNKRLVLNMSDLEAFKETLITKN